MMFLVCHSTIQAFSSTFNCFNTRINHNLRLQLSTSVNLFSIISFRHEAGQEKVPMTTSLPDLLFCAKTSRLGIKVPILISVTAINWFENLTCLCETVGGTMKHPVQRMISLMTMITNNNTFGISPVGKGSRRRSYGLVNENGEKSMWKEFSLAHIKVASFNQSYTN